MRGRKQWLCCGLCYGLRPVVGCAVVRGQWVEVGCAGGLRPLVVWVYGGLGGEIKWVVRIKNKK